MIHSAEEFVRLRESEDPNEYQRASKEEASEAVWLDVVTKYPEMKTWVIQNKTVPLSVLRLLSRDPDASVRWDVACKRKLDDELFLNLAHDVDETVRQRVAINKKAPKHILKFLSSDSSFIVREAVHKRLKD